MKTNRWPLINFIDAELIWTDDRGQSRLRAYPAEPPQALNGS
jgi:hypothetical protein